MVSDTRNLFECGSVQIKCASVSRTLLSPFSFLRHIASSSWDSGRASCHACGGDRNRSQFLQNETDAIDHIRILGSFKERSAYTLLRNSFCYINPVSRIERQVVDEFRNNISTYVFLRHGTHRFAELGTIGVPQSAHSTRCTAGAGTKSISLFSPCWSLVGPRL
jgi:hypothetical protein